MKNVRVRAMAGNGHAGVMAAERHLTCGELLLAIKSFSVEAAPLAERGHWLWREATLALRRTRGRRERLRQEAALLRASADGDEAAAAAKAEAAAAKSRRPPSRAPRA
jgi:hypothetical protein